MNALDQVIAELSAELAESQRSASRPAESRLPGKSDKPEQRQTEEAQRGAEVRLLREGNPLDRVIAQLKAELKEAQRPRSKH